MLICVVSYPRSGQVWLTRLLAQSIGCPVYTYLPQDVGRDVAYEGADRRSPHRVTRAHWYHGDDGSEYWPKTDKTIHIVRDPRDIAVSLKHYFRFPDYDGSIDYLKNNSWGEFVETYGAAADAQVKYSDLLGDTVNEVRRLITACGLEPDQQAIAQAVEDQKMSKRKADIKTGAVDPAFSALQQQRHMRIGKTRQWETELSESQVDAIESAFRSHMERYGYLA